MLRVVGVEAMARKNAASASALQSDGGQNQRFTSSNDVSSEAFGGKMMLKLLEWATRLSVRSFEAQVVYAFTRTGSG